MGAGKLKSRGAGVGGGVFFWSEYCDRSIPYFNKNNNAFIFNHISFLLLSILSWLGHINFAFLFYFFPELIDALNL